MSSSVTGRGPRYHGVAWPQVGQRLAERVPAAGVAGRARHPGAGDGGQHPRASLHGRALHVVQHAADAAHLLAAAGPAGSAVHQRRQRRAVAGRLGGVVGVEHEQPAVPRRDAEHDLAGELGVAGDDRADQAAEPARGQSITSSVPE